MGGFHITVIHPEIGSYEFYSCWQQGPQCEHTLFVFWDLSISEKYRMLTSAAVWRKFRKLPEKVRVIPRQWQGGGAQACLEEGRCSPLFPVSLFWSTVFGCDKILEKDSLKGGLFTVAYGACSWSADFIAVGLWWFRMSCQRYRGRARRLTGRTS